MSITLSEPELGQLFYSRDHESICRTLDLKNRLVVLFRSFPLFMNRIILTNAATNLARKAIVRTERKDICLQFLTVAFSIIYRLHIGMLMGAFPA